MKCTDLKQEDIVIFKRYCDITEEETYQDGSVAKVDDERKQVCIFWLEGYKSRFDEVPYDKVIARFNINGEHMSFGVYSGNSDLIEHY